MRPPCGGAWRARFDVGTLKFWYLALCQVDSWLALCNVDKLALCQVDKLALCHVDKLALCQVDKLALCEADKLAL